MSRNICRVLFTLYLVFLAKLSQSKYPDEVNIYRFPFKYLFGSIFIVCYQIATGPYQLLPLRPESVVVRHHVDDGPGAGDLQHVLPGHPLPLPVLPPAKPAQH